MAAAVLLVGRFDESPILQIFLYLVCYRLSLFTLTKPVASPKPLSAMNAWGLCGGTMCKASNGTVTFFFVSYYSKTA